MSGFEMFIADASVVRRAVRVQNTFAIVVILTFHVNVSCSRYRNMRYHTNLHIYKAYNDVLSLLYTLAYRLHININRLLKYIYILKQFENMEFDTIVIHIHYFNLLVLILLIRKYK